MNQYNQTASAYTRLKGIAVVGPCTGTARLIVGDGANSLVVKKVLGTQPCGARMPEVAGAGCTGGACLSAADIAKLSTWITQGALNN